jgi:O-antigen ligase
MEMIEGRSGDRPLVPIAIILSSLAILTMSVVDGASPRITAPTICLIVAAALSYRVALRWTTLTGLLVAVILFVPIRRYTLPVNLPFSLELYRLAVILIGAGWLISLLVDPRVRTRPTGFRAPLILFAFGAFASIIANPGTVNAVHSQVIKQLSYFGSFILVLCLIASVIRTHEHVDTIVKVLVSCASVVSFFALIQSKTDYNVFDHLTSFLPFLHVGYIPETPLRGGRFRTYASAQHSIELGAILVMIFPLALYLARRTGRRRWLALAALVLLAALSTLSRTGMLMLLVIAATFVVLRPRETRRLWPLLIPLLAAVHIAMPGTLGTFKQAFFPKGGLIKEQQSDPGYIGSGRLADLGPALAQVGRDPLLGRGFGTRITDGPKPNAPILDDQWLGTLVETGIVGVVAWLWLFLRAIRRFGGVAKHDYSDAGWLLAAITGAVTAFMFAMFTFDAFSFTQVTFILFIELALGQVMLSVIASRDRPPEPEPAV